MTGHGRRTRAASTLVYALLVGLVSVAAVAALDHLGGETNALFDQVGQELRSAADRPADDDAGDDASDGGETDVPPPLPAPAALVWVGGDSRMLDQTSLTPACETVTVMNTGEIASSPLSVDATGSYALLGCTDGCSGQSLDAGQTCDLGVRPTATGNGPLAGLVTVSAPPAADAALTLTGTASNVAPAQLAAPAFAAVTQRLGDIGCAAVTVTNTGDQPSSALSVLVMGQYQRCSGSCLGQVLAPGGSCSVSVRGTGSNQGSSLSGSLQIQATDGGTVTTALSGSVQCNAAQGGSCDLRLYSRGPVCNSTCPTPSPPTVLEGVQGPEDCSVYVGTTSRPPGLCGDYSNPPLAGDTEWRLLCTGQLRYCLTSRPGTGTVQCDGSCD